MHWSMVDYGQFESFTVSGSQYTALGKSSRSPGPSFMALLTVSTESALTEAGNFVLTASVFHGIAGKF